MTELPKTYDPTTVENEIYDFWRKGDFFRARQTPGRKPYTIMIPPPNVTGRLHIGHGLNNTIQDILIRYRRMLGHDTLWLPGTDHAGIATQNVVERELANEGQTRYDVGRTALVERIWKWREEFGGVILRQLEKLGCSCDWSRTRFTMDEMLSRAVKENFKRLYDAGLIYRGKYIVNWCPRDRTTLSDDEVEKEPTEGRLWHIRYPFADDPQNGVTVATTRPETMLGDTAVAVNPGDARYKNAVGREVELPFTGRRIKIIADEYVDSSFGSGAVKITPAHDPNDFDVARRNGLAHLCVMNPDATMNENVPEKYRGLDRYACRKALVEDLTAAGLLEKTEAHELAAGKCYRCGTVIEPRESDQWFVKMRPLADKAIALQSDPANRIDFHPARWEKVYLDWLINVRDWPISRQIWWGHRIPVWYCDDCEHVNVATEPPAQCGKCGGDRLRQDEDVLDTWFSSALWPFSTLGWPDKTADLEYFYPTDVLVTDRGIIYFWVARMVMMGLFNLGRRPFRDVYINATVLDERGRKMSKSLGNGIDPLVMIDGGRQEYLGDTFECPGYGADALRFSLVMLTVEGQDVKLSPTKFEMGRNFNNKLWNAARFALMNFEKIEPVALADGDFEFEDVWIRRSLDRTIRKASACLDRYQLNEACNQVYDFFWHALCDWYLEIVKPRMFGTDAKSRFAAQQTLYVALDATLKLLHPFVPFITERLWRHYRELKIGERLGLGAESATSIMVSNWPEAAAPETDEAIFISMAAIQEVVRAARNLRAKYKVKDKTALSATVRARTNEAAGVLTANVALLRRMANLAEVTVSADAAKPENAAVEVVGEYEVYVPLGGLIDKDAEIGRLREQKEKIQKLLDGIDAKLDNADFIGRAPAAVVQRERDRRAEFAQQIAAVDQNLRELEN